MLQTIDIPSPSAADNETVITALETAAIFGAKGDGHEAMRWLRRAAESAGAAGDDERALSLSRLAAELHDELSGTRPIASPRLPSPPPPPAQVSYPPPPSSRAAAPSSVPRPSQVPRPSSQPTEVTASRPPLAAVPAEPAAPEPTPAPAEGTGARHAARVAVSISTTKVGYLEVRLLAEGEAPRLGASEGVLVMLDPASTLLAR